MASIIRIKRSSGTNKPSSLQWGELGYVTGIGSYGGLNQYKDRIFIGDDGTNVNPVGGYYYTSMMEHQPGAIDGVTNTRNSDGGIVAVLDNERKVDQWNVDNLRLDLNTLSSTNTDGDIILDPNGVGEVNIVDDTYLSFGNDKDVKLRYDETTDNRFEIEGADWAYANGVAINIGDVTESVDKDTGALVVEGGVGVEKNLNVGGSTNITGDISVVGVSSVTGIASFFSDVYISGELNIGSSTFAQDITARNLNIAGLSTFTASIDANGDLDVDGRTELDITNISETLNVVGISTFASDVDINADLDVDGHTELDQLNVSGVSTFVGNVTSDGIVTITNVTESVDKDTGALVVEGGVGVEKNLNVGGSINVDGASIFDSIKIENNVISTLSGSGDTLYIDPYPDGLSNEGNVIIKGNLQVDGTTTTVNSTTVDINDPILILGDVTSSRTVMETVVSGVSTIRLDSVVGINTGDIVSGNAGLNVGAANTIVSYDLVNKIITLNDPTISGINTTTQLTITHAYDTNTDRGVGFNYNTSSGSSNNKIGFFGLDDSSIADSGVTPLTNGTHADNSRRWTYIPDATITNGIVSGTKGFLDVKGIYYQSGDFNTNGVVFFDDTGLQRSTNNPASPTLTSKQILTAVTKNTLTLGSSITANAGDIIRQDSSGAYGVVETSVSSASSVDLIGVEGTFTNTYNIRREGQNGFIENLSSIPSAVTVIYTNKPTWTSTLDGGNF
jgi:hypothetical protein